MKKLFFSLFIIVVAKINAQYSIPAPLETEALAKLKTSDALLSELKSNGLSITDITIKLKKKEVLFLSSDEVCYRIYKDSKKLEGSNYVFDYDISTKPNKSGDVYTSVGHVWYTRVDITETTCNIGTKWRYEYSQADAFSLVTKNGFLSAAQAEKLILDTLSKGFDLDSYTHSYQKKNLPNNKWTEICRLDNFKTCAYDSFEYTEQGNQVINKMEDNKHRISFEIEIYRGDYETGNAYASMYSVKKSFCLVNCYFDKKNGQVFLTKIELVKERNTTDVITENKYGNLPLTTYYVPISKTKLENIRNKFEESKPANTSVLYLLNGFENLVNELNNTGSDSYLAVFKKYFTTKAAEKMVKNVENLTSNKFKPGVWQIKKNQDVNSCEIECVFKGKKGALEGIRFIADTRVVDFTDGKYLYNVD